MTESEKTNKKPTKDKSSRKRKTAGKVTSAVVAISVGLMIIALAFSGYLISDGIKVSSSSIINEYDSAYTLAKDSAYEEFTSNAFNYAESKYHVSNKALIRIDDLKETQNLEVLHVSDVEFITEETDNISGDVTAWLEATGEGDFVVNLQAAEFSIDKDRYHVTVRLPNPELTNVRITKVEKCLFVYHSVLSNGSYREGVELAINQREQAQLQIQQSLLSDPYIFSNAQDVAKSTIENLVRQFNPDIPDLTVDVEFMDDPT